MTGDSEIIRSFLELLDLFQEVVGDEPVKLNYKCPENPPGSGNFKCDLPEDGGGGDSGRSGDADLPSKYKKSDKESPYRKYNSDEPIPIYKSPYPVADDIVSSEGLKKTDAVAGAVNSRLDGYDVPKLTRIEIGQFEQSSFRPLENVMRINAASMSEENRKWIMREAGKYYKKYGKYDDAEHAVVLNGKKDLVDVVIEHESAHAIMSRFNEIKSGAISKLRKEKEEKLAPVIDTATDDEWLKLTKSFSRKIDNTVASNPEWNALVKKSIKSGWKLPTKYSKTSMVEAFAECYVLHKNGFGEEMLTPEIEEYISVVDAAVRKT